MEAAAIIEKITSAGGQIWLQDDKVRARLPEALRPLVILIHTQKPELMEELARRPIMPPGVRLVGWEPKAAPVQLSPWSTVTEVDKFIRATLAQVDARLHHRRWSGVWTLSVLLDRLAACGCRIALDDPTIPLQ